MLIYVSKQFSESWNQHNKGKRKQQKCLKLVKCPLKYRVAMTLLCHLHTSFVKSETLKRFSRLVKESTNNPKVGIDIHCAGILMKVPITFEINKKMVGNTY